MCVEVYCFKVMTEIQSDQFLRMIDSRLITITVLLDARIASGMDRAGSISANFRLCSEALSNFTRQHRGEIPESVYYNTLVLAVRRRLFVLLQAKAIYSAVIGGQDLFTHTENAFQTFFHQHLTIPRQPPAPQSHDRPRVKGPSDSESSNSLSDGGPEDDESDLSSQWRFTILENLHKRLSALECRMGA